MASRSEYDSTFDSEINSIMSFPADTRSDVMKHGAEARRRIVRAFNNFTKGISARWKERFKEIKEENDLLQKDLKESYAHAHDVIDDLIGDQIARLPKR